MNDWQQSLREAYREPLRLLKDLHIDPARIDWLDPTPSEFAMRVPRGFAARMQIGNPQDPLLLQVLPRRAEHEDVAGFVPDPLGEAQFQPFPGLIHKYHGRALLIATGACGIHCRYCFRREFPYAQARQGTDGWQAALTGLRADPSIEEIILSGGDPLSLSDDKLERLIEQLDDIAQLRRLRLHTRQIIALPERVTPRLLEIFARSRLRVVVVIHSNHANELDSQVQEALAQLRQIPALLLNQTVLLAGINDSAAILAQLSQRLFECGVQPYYLHQLDAVRGAAHFALADETARGIMRNLNAQLPGYLVPRLVREVPGAPGKSPLNWGPLD